MLKTKKKLLIISERFYPEEFRINDLALAWANEGYDVRVISQTPSYPKDKIFEGYKNKFSIEDWNGVRIYRVPTITGYTRSLLLKIISYFNFMILACIYAVYLGRKSDFIFCFQTGSITGALPGVLIRKLYNKRFVLWIQDFWPDSVYAYGFKKRKVVSFFLDVFVRFFYRNCDTILISCEGFLDKLKSYVPAEVGIQFVPNWADKLTKIKNPFVCSRREKIHFTFAGNIGNFQNLENVIYAFSKLDNNLRKITQLNVIGDGSNLLQLKDFVSSLKLDNVIFHGRKPSFQMAAYYAASDVLLISLINHSLFEVTIPSKFQTYLCAGKPIMSVINGEVSKVVEKYKLGLASGPDDIDAISDLFKSFILMDEKTELRYANNCLDYYEEKYSFSKAKDNIVRALVK
jgi:glycosyltransferase involved in cell wall biosynthesis